ncbi:MAG: chaperone NapD [Proteobacteria bacterium]|nr:chaperone NapD [Pseudomonadota bacterium]
MPIFSYLVYPEHNKKQHLIDALLAERFCEIKVAENEEVLILVTDTPDEKTNKDLLDRIQKLESLQSLSMTFGHT